MENNNKEITAEELLTRAEDLVQNTHNFDNAPILAGQRDGHHKLALEIVGVLYQIFRTG